MVDAGTVLPIDAQILLDREATPERVTKANQVSHLIFNVALLSPQTPVRSHKRTSHPLGEREADGHCEVADLSGKQAAESVFIYYKFTPADPQPHTSILWSWYA